ncbi:MAG: hypothetical protein GXP21_03720 [Gammaproteobacteria bacterium]|nr:hypothetical protein [Gammaproteobacteria bacterium]
MSIKIGRKTPIYWGGVDIPGVFDHGRCQRRAGMGFMTAFYLNTTW